MPRTKRASRGKGSRKALTVLSVAGMSLASATNGAVAEISPQGPAPLHAAPLYEEEIFDVSLATFHLFDQERAGANDPLMKLRPRWMRRMRWLPRVRWRRWLPRVRWGRWLPRMCRRNAWMCQAEFTGVAECTDVPGRGCRGCGGGCGWGGWWGGCGGCDWCLSWGGCNPWC